MEPVGLLLVDKPEGPTSHDAVTIVRRALGIRRVGHAGTLDPFASGLLILCLSWATRLAEYLSALPKTYRGIIRLGERTDTDDRTGTVISSDPGWRKLAVQQVRAALDRQLGEIRQRPPAYSAKQLAGKRAYAVARKGGKPELKPARVTISRLSVTGFAPPDVSVEIECSSGTYVRAVARDVGDSLGLGAHLTELRRLRIGGFSVENAWSLRREATRDQIVDRLLPPEAAVTHLRRTDVEDAAARALRCGRSIEWPEAGAERPVAVLTNGELVAVAEARHGRLWPRKVFGYQRC